MTKNYGQITEKVKAVKRRNYRTKTVISFICSRYRSLSNWNLKQKIHIKEELPPLNEANSVGQALCRFLRDKKVWQKLKEEALSERQQCVPYSFRQIYSYVDHNRQKNDGTYRAPKQISDAMGHSLDVHLASYA